MDLSERVKIAVLTKHYGNMLTKKQSTIISMYVDNNLSLAEVSEELNITRQAVKDALDKALKYLFTLEEKLGFVKKYNNLKNAIMGIPPMGINKNEKEKLLKILEE